MNIRLRTLQFMAMPAVVGVALLIHGPIAQFADYHHFADSRTVFGIVNFSDTVSNLPFLVIGMAGVACWLRKRTEERSWAWLAVFLGAIAVAFGSTYYHQAPDDSRLVWDRLPIALTFMAFFVALLEEGLAAALPRVLGCALAVAALSVFYWQETGDLRPYLWTQVVPLLAIPVSLVTFPARFTQRHGYWAVFACYLVAKLCEVLDFQLFAYSHGIVSGHSLKHLVAAAGLAVLVRMYAVRLRSADSASAPEGLGLDPSK
jgi:hypothetical protein